MSAVMVSMAVPIRSISSGIHTQPVHTAFEWNWQMVAVSRILCGIANGNLYPENHFE